MIWPEQDQNSAGKVPNPTAPCWHQAYHGLIWTAKGPGSLAPWPLPPTVHIASSLLGWFLSMAVELASCFTSLTFWGLYCNFGFIFTASFFILSGHPWRNLTLSYIAWLYHLSGNVTQASMTLSLPLYCNFDACKTSTMWLMLPSSFANLRVWYYTLLGLHLQQPLLVLTLGQLHWAVAFQVQE